MKRLRYFFGGVFLSLALPAFVLVYYLRQAWRLNRQAIRWTSGETRYMAGTIGDLLRDAFRSRG